MKSTYACLDENQIVFDFTEFDVLSSDPVSVIAQNYYKVDETALPDIGDVWTGDGFIKP